MKIFAIFIYLVINYGASLEDMIAAGKYTWVNESITAKNFPVEGAGIVRFESKIFHFNRGISSDDAVAAIQADDPQNPWAPAKIEHLLAYGAMNPEEQRQYPSVGLGSVAKVEGGCFVSYLYRSDAGRNLDLGWWGNDWHGGYRFLAVRKLPFAA